MSRTVGRPPDNLRRPTHRPGRQGPLPSSIPRIGTIGRTASITIRLVGATAFVDESEPSRTADPGVYLLAAAVVRAEESLPATAAMRRLLLPGQQKVHRNREPRREPELASAVASTGVRHLVVVRSSDDTTTSERRRRLCLKRLLRELEMLTEVDAVVLEARQSKQNEGDRRLLDSLRAGREISGQLRMSHVAGPREPGTPRNVGTPRAHFRPLREAAAPPDGTALAVRTTTTGPRPAARP
jgi:hypothetical protein